MKSLENLFDYKKLKWDDEVIIPNTRNIRNYGNKIYNRYPARSSFLAYRSIISSNFYPDIKILDPFMGSGTLAVEASLFDTEIFGCEMDPFARLVSEVSILRYDENDLKCLENILKDILDNFIDYKPNIDLYPNLKNIEYWFEKDVFDSLLKLKSYIYDKYDTSKYIDYLKVIFADCIKPSSLLERQSTKPYISSKYKKITKPVNESFSYSFFKHLNATKEYNLEGVDRKSKKINWLSFDATSIEFKKELVDLVITSPPYLNAFDYTSIIKIDSSWVGTLVNNDIDILRSKQVGHQKRKDNNINNEVYLIFKSIYDEILSSEVKNKKHNSLSLAKTCLSYFNDIYLNLSCIYNGLTTNGQYHMIIGDNVVNNIMINTHKIIAELAIAIGFKWIGYYKFPIKDHRTSIPRNGKGGKIDVEYVIILEK